MNWGWLLARVAISATIFSLLFLSQRYWYRALWRMTANWGSTPVRVIVRSIYLFFLAAIIAVLLDAIRMGHTKLVPGDKTVGVLAGLWFTSALFAYVGVKAVSFVDWLWISLRRKVFKKNPANSNVGVAELLPDPSRRYFFKTATAVAGAAPFLSAVYGCAAERLNYQTRRVEIPIHNLPPALDGMTIVQLSDIHLSSYMPREQVRRAVDMANDLHADLAVVTGDFITAASDPILDCIEELRELRTPLGTFGCNGNHEIYANAEATAHRLFNQAGMTHLRQQNTQVTFRGASLNLIGVDYQRERTPRGRKIQMLENLAPLVRRDMPNILLSHNPNSFNRAAELGVELSLAGHTHGGQVQVEILDHRLSPARFITDYVAGLYYRPLLMPALDERATPGNRDLNVAYVPNSALYVNRGLGTVGAPLRLGVPPEITLIVLRRA